MRPISSKATIPNPPGYAPPSLSSSSSSNTSKKTGKASSNAVSAKPGQTGEVAKPKRDLVALRAQKAWDLAIGPAKSVPMQVRCDCERFVLI